MATRINILKSHQNNLDNLTSKINLTQKTTDKGFSGGAMVKNLPANAGDTGSSPGPGRSHTPQSNKARVPQLLKPAHLEPVFRNEKPKQ